MNQNVKIFAIALSAFLVGSVINNFAMSASALPVFKFAVVDIKKVAASSTEFSVLKESQKAKVQDLTTFVKNAKADLANQKDVAQKKTLEDKYNKELNDRKNKMDKEYSAKLAIIDKNISDTISTTAKAQDYKLVLQKGVVLFGGDDITDTVSKAVK